MKGDLQGNCAIYVASGRAHGCMSLKTFSDASIGEATNTGSSIRDVSLEDIVRVKIATETSISDVNEKTRGLSGLKGNYRTSVDGRGLGFLNL